MASTKHVMYLFDPLCGWCYGASPAIQQLADGPRLKIHLGS